MSHFLIKSGFEKEFPDEAEEPKYFWWRKNIDHPFLKGLHIIVDSYRIGVWCNEQLTGEKNEVIIHREINFTEEKLLKILKWLEK